MITQNILILFWEGITPFSRNIKNILAIIRAYQCIYVLGKAPLLNRRQIPILCSMYTYISNSLSSTSFNQGHSECTKSVHGVLWFSFTVLTLECLRLNVLCWEWNIHHHGNSALYDTGFQSLFDELRTCLCEPSQYHSLFYKASYWNSVLLLYIVVRRKKLYEGTYGTNVFLLELNSLI